VLCDTHSIEGTPHTEIVKRAQEIGADLIVMGSHGHGGLAHAVLGSVTERVLHRTPCPVLVVTCANSIGEVQWQFLAALLSLVLLPGLFNSRRPTQRLYQGRFRGRACSGGDVHLQSLPLREGRGRSPRWSGTGVHPWRFSSWPSAPTTPSAIPRMRFDKLRSAGDSRSTASPIYTT